MASQTISLASINSLPVYKFIRPLPFVDTTPLPVATTRSGSLFNDRFSPTTKWYLPNFTLPADQDQLFSFAASQSGTDEQGHPFNKCMLTLGLKRTIPDDAQNFKEANPTIQLKEIALSNLSATLTTSFTDSDTGNTGHNNYAGKLTPTANDGYQLTFDNILGPATIILYNNLLQHGASIAIAFHYDSWIPIPQKPPLKPPIILHPVPKPPIVVAHPHPFIHPRILNLVQVKASVPITSLIQHPTQPANPDYSRSTISDLTPLPLDNKYNADSYTLKYTISSAGSPARPIINQNDLLAFNLKQSEFQQLKTFGDIQQKYPSLSRLYIGTLSKTIVAIPVTYSIIRSSHGLHAICAAVVDSDAGSDSKCKFEFTFIIAPDVSPIQLAQLSQDISKVPELNGYSLTLPGFLKEGSTPKLLSFPQSSATSSNTPDKHLFGLSIGIRDQQNSSPAVAEANLIIARLCQDQDPYLLATISLKLDDNFADPVETNVILNFHKTSGSDELIYSINENLKTISFKNNSPFDIMVDRYAVSDGNSLTITSPATEIRAGESVSSTFEAGPDNITVIAESEIVDGGPVPKQDIEKYLLFQVENVAETKYVFGINAASVDFDTLGIDSIDVQITVAELPNLSIPQFSLVKLRSINSSSALVPIQNAISSLNADLLITVRYLDTSKASVRISLKHQFIDSPILILQDQDLNKN